MKNNFMISIDAIMKGIKTVREENKKPQSFKDGEKFEKYIRENIFTKELYECLEMTHNWNTNKNDYIKSSLKPDFTFKDRMNKKEFYVEAKYRYEPFHGKYEWCTIEQLKRYKEYNKERPVFIMLGTEGWPDEPDKISLIPLSLINYTGLFESVVTKYEIKLDTPIPSKILWTFQ